MYNEQGQRIQIPAEFVDGSDLLVFRYFVGCADLPQVTKAILIGETGRENLPALAEFTDLNRLTLMSISIDESVVRDVCALRKLSSVQLVDCKIDAGQLRAMREGLPNCVVRTERELPRASEDFLRRLEQLANATWLGSQ
jgi:hypothetical protein